LRKIGVAHRKNAGHGAQAFGERQLCLGRTQLRCTQPRNGQHVFIRHNRQAGGAYFGGTQGVEQEGIGDLGGEVGYCKKRKK
jgi:hypothetical protein